MYNVSQDYLDYINNDANVGRFSKNKVVIDGIAYLSDTLKSNPKISHKATNLIGGFPAKTCNFEILNTDGTLILNNKEITVYKGLDIDGSTEWVQMGIFSARDEDITTDQTTKSISFSGTDRTTLFDVVYTSSLDWTTSHTGLEIVEEITTSLGITLETTAFNFATHVFTEKPNFNEASTNREIIQRIAEIGGEIAYISRVGGLRIVGQTITNQAAGKAKREKLTKELQFGPVNTVVLGKEGIDDDIIYQNQSMIDAPKKNKIDLSAYQETNYHKGTFSITGDDLTITVTQVASGSNNFIAQWILQLEPNTEYTLSWLYNHSNPNQSIRWYMYDDNLWGNNLASSTEGATQKTFTTSASGYIVLGLYVTSSIAVGDVIDISDLMLELGSTKTNFEKYELTGPIEWKILDNPYVDLIRESIIDEVASHIIGMSLVPYTITGFIDDYIYDLNDVISITDNNGIAFNAVMLEYETQSRIKSNIAASTQTETTTDYQIAGSTKQSIAKVQLQVNHNTQEISSLATITEELEQKVDNYDGQFDEIRSEIQTNTTQINQTTEQIVLNALEEYTKTTDFETFKQTIQTTITQTNEDITFSFDNLQSIINNMDTDVQEQFQEISKYIRFDGGISLGEVGNDITLRIENDIIYFSVAGVSVMDITPNGIEIDSAKFKYKVEIGSDTTFSFIIEDDGSFSLV